MGEYRKTIPSSFFNLHSNIAVKYTLLNTINHLSLVYSFHSIARRHMKNALYLWKIYLYYICLCVVRLVCCSENSLAHLWLLHNLSNVLPSHDLHINAIECELFFFFVVVFIHCFVRSEIYFFYFWRRSIICCEWRRISRTTKLHSYKELRQPNSNRTCLDPQQQQQEPFYQNDLFAWWLCVRFKVLFRFFLCFFVVVLMRCTFINIGFLLGSDPLLRLRWGKIKCLWRN